MNENNKKGVILIIVDTPTNLTVLFDALRDFGYELLVAQNGEIAIKRAELVKPDLILLDVIMPGFNGLKTCQRLKENGKTKHIPIMFMTVINEPGDKVRVFSSGALDYITKPILHEEVLVRVNTHLINQYLKKKVQEQKKELKKINEKLEQLAYIKTNELSADFITINDLSDDLVKRLTAAAEYRDNETGIHNKRIGLYVKELAESLKMPKDFISEISFASELHDIGKIGILDSILLKKGSLSLEEFREMQKHTSIGADILSGSPHSRIRLAESIALTHHERWNGTGYPMGLSGEDIPIEARIIIICDQYDALRMIKPYKTCFDHNRTMEIITQGDGRTKPTHMDPEVLNRFVIISDRFEDIFNTYKED